jgi:hypothetical protein
MTRAKDTEIIDKFEQFYRDYYRNEIGQLAQKYPNEKRSLYIEWDDLYRFDPDIADDFIAQPDQMLEYAEEALRLYDLPVDVKLGQAHVRVVNLQRTSTLSNIGARHRGQLVEIPGIVKTVEDPKQMITEAAFECQRCGTLTRLSQTSQEFNEPRECQGCERKGPFEINHDQSEFIDSQRITLCDRQSIMGDVSMDSIDVLAEDDLVGEFTPGAELAVTIIPRLEKDSGSEFEFRFDAVGVTSTDSEHNGIFDILHSLADTAVSGATSDDDKNEHDGSPLPVPDVTVAGSETVPVTTAASAVVGTHPDDIREEETKAKLITPFIASLGWVRYNYAEWKMEYTDEKTDKRVDYALFGPESDAPDVVIEAKQLGAPLPLNEEQLYTYVRVFDAEWGILTDGRTYRLYYNGEAIDDSDSLPTHIATLSISDLDETLPPILTILTRRYWYSDDGLSVTAEIERLAKTKNTTVDNFQSTAGSGDESGDQSDAEKATPGNSKTQRDRIKNILDIIRSLEEEYDAPAPIEETLDQAVDLGLERSQTEHEIEKLKRSGDVYEDISDDGEEHGLRSTE